MKDLNENSGAGSAGAVVQADSIYEKFGLPFVPDANGNPQLNERAIAATCSNDKLVRYDSVRGIYLCYEKRAGLWKEADEVQVKRLLSDLLSDLGQQHGQEEFVRRITSARLQSLVRMIQIHSHEAPFEETAGLLHVANGVVDLRGEAPVLLPHSPTYAFSVGSPVNYHPAASCEKFLSTLLRTALTEADISLVMRYCGSMLLGPNLSHRLLIFRGTPGGGKTTFVTTLEMVIGESQVAYLRPQHLGGRFESSAFKGKRLLVSTDIPGDALSHAGARFLKALVGDDNVEAEVKHSPAKVSMRGQFHVIMASNSRLRLALDGDGDAWDRRLYVVDFDKPKPVTPIPDFARLLVAEEGSGILNWLTCTKNHISLRKRSLSTGPGPDEATRPAQGGAEEVCPRNPRPVSEGAEEAPGSRHDPNPMESRISCPSTLVEDARPNLQRERNRGAAIV